MRAGQGDVVGDDTPSVAQGRVTAPPQGGAERNAARQLPLKGEALCAEYSHIKKPLRSSGFLQHMCYFLGFLMFACAAARRAMGTR